MYELAEVIQKKRPTDAAALRRRCKRSTARRQVTAGAQQAGKLPTIGFLGADASAFSPWTAAFVVTPARTSRALPKFESLPDDDVGSASLAVSKLSSRFDVFAQVRRETGKE